MTRRQRHRGSSRPSVVIPARFNGPPGSGNGGYSCGAIADAIDVPVEVTLRRPPPLDTELLIRPIASGWTVTHDDLVVADAALTESPPPPPPRPPHHDEAAAAMEQYLGHRHHDFPNCFTCGPARDDGLRIFSGPVGRDDLVAAVWVPHHSLPSGDGAVAVPIVWAALDCPGAWTAMRSRTDSPVVLGRMAAEIVRRPRVGEPLVSYAWRTGGEGRKAYAGTALADAAGTPIAWARQTWIALRTENREPRAEDRQP
jgi:hypothetical protein